MTARSLRDEFHDVCTKAVALADQVDKARTQQGRALPPLQRNLVFETAFLRILLGWERFLEDIFVHYLCGRPGMAGSTFTHRIITPQSVELARKVITGDLDYLTWTSGDVVKDRAEYWLGSKQRFIAAYGKVPDLKDMYRIRNRVAHTSANAKTEFEKARSKHVPGRSHYRGFGPGMVLRYARSNQRNLDRFASQLKNAATEIAEGP
jgi:hypothetical protein